MFWNRFEHVLMMAVVVVTMVVVGCSAPPPSANLTISQPSRASDPGPQEFKAAPGSDAVQAE